LILLYIHIQTINPSDTRLLEVAKKINAVEAAKKIHRNSLSSTQNEENKPAIIEGLMIDTGVRPPLESHHDDDEDKEAFAKEYLYPQEIREKARDYTKVVRHLGASAMPTKHCAQEFRILLRERDTKITSLKILFYDYLPQYWYFEIIMCISRLCMTCVLPAFIAADNQLGLLYATTLVCFGFCVMVTMVQPFVDSSVNYASCILAALTTLTMTLTVWLFVEDNLVKSVRARWSTSSLGNSLVFLNITIGPLSLFIDMSVEFGFVTFLGSSLAAILTFQMYRLHKKVKQATSPKAKVVPESNDDATTQDKKSSVLTTQENNVLSLPPKSTETPLIEQTVSPDSPTSSVGAQRLPPLNVTTPKSADSVPNNEPGTSFQDNASATNIDDSVNKTETNHEDDNISYVDLQR